MAIDYAPLEDAYEPPVGSGADKPASAPAREPQRKATSQIADFFKNDKTECNYILAIFLIGVLIISMSGR